ncbi:MAG: DUF1178 family protein [Methylocystis sp.]|nr:DUF1178 family protein [Methylocystis sp.]MBI3275874.1 DUF1178 family protein [Methylocystis sp.]
MIRYALVCAEGHDFDGWFKDSAAYEAQAARGLVACPLCRSAQVSKAVMAPNVARTDRARQEAMAAPTPAPPASVREDLDERRARAMMRELRETIVASTEDVGGKFPDEARRIQDGEAEPRPIRGRASFAEARALLEEGIEILPLPALPSDGN